MDDVRRPDLESAYELIARGELPVICLGRRRLVPEVIFFAPVGQRQSEAPGSVPD